jgi:predicted N-acetyltransferase YhbS
MKTPPADLHIDHLARTPQHIETVARMIYREFWADVDGGLTEQFLVDHLRRTGDPDRVPLSLVALSGGEVLGTVNLIDNDDTKRTHLHPWLAAMVVAQPWRGSGIGTRLVQALLADARRLGFAQVWFGTDGPGFYARLGARLHEQVTPAFCIMQFPLGSETARAVPPCAA